MVKLGGVLLGVLFCFEGIMLLPHLQAPPENSGKVFSRKSSDDNVHEIKLLKGSVAAFDPIVRPRRILPGGLTRIGKVTYTTVSDHLYRTRGRMLRVLVHQFKPKND